MIGSSLIGYIQRRRKIRNILRDDCYSTKEVLDSYRIEEPIDFLTSTGHDIKEIVDSGSDSIADIGYLSWKVSVILIGIYLSYKLIEKNK